MGPSREPLREADGRFVVYLPAGTYTVTVAGSRDPAVAVSVHAGGFAEVSLSIDTGIR